MLKTFAILMMLSFCGWFALLLASPTGPQRDIFPRDPNVYFQDFFMPRSCLSASDRYAGTAVAPRKDCCYTMFAFEVLRPFPENRKGAIAFSAIGALVLMASVFLFSKREGLSGKECLLVIGAFMCSGTFIRSLERSNQIFLSAACMALFFCFYSSRLRRERVLAFSLLAIATVLKISPALAGIVYFARVSFAEWKRSVDWSSVLGAAVLGVGLFLLPYYLDGNGMSDICCWMQNVKIHTDSYLSTWGLQGAYTYASGVLSRVCPVITQSMCRIVSLILGISCFCIVFPDRGRHVFFVVAAMLLIPSNTLFYMGFYLFPALVQWLAELKRRPVGFLDFVQLILWGVIFSPLQVVCNGVSVSAVIAGIALNVLVVIRIAEFACGLWVGGGRR